MYLFEVEYHKELDNYQQHDNIHDHINNYLMKHLHHTMNTIVRIWNITAVPMCWHVREYNTPVWREVSCHGNISILRAGEAMEHYNGSTGRTCTAGPLQVTNCVFSYLNTLCRKPSN